MVSTVFPTPFIGVLAEKFLYLAKTDSMTSDVPKNFCPQGIVSVCCRRNVWRLLMIIRTEGYGGLHRQCNGRLGAASAAKNRAGDLCRDDRPGESLLQKTHRTPMALFNLHDDTWAHYA